MDEYQQPTPKPEVFNTNYFRQKRNFIIIWWAGLCVVFALLAWGYFFLALYTAVPLAFYRAMLPYRDRAKSKCLTAAQFVSMVCFNIYLAATGTMNHLMNALWNQDSAWLLGVALIFFYLSIVVQDYRFFSKLTAEEVAEYYRK